MKALSIRQPWAWLIVDGTKDIENREWFTSYRCPVLIHASKKWDQNGFDYANAMGEFVPNREDHIFGAIIGKVNLVDCVMSRSSKWFFGLQGFVFQDPIEFKTAIPYRGQLGFFDVPIGLFHDTITLKETI